MVNGIRIFVVAILVASIGMAAFACDAAAASASTDITRSTQALRSFLEKATPPAANLLNSSLCVGVVPHDRTDDSAELGQGIISCRKNTSSPWSAPAGIQMTGGGLVWDLAGTRMDVLFLVNTPDALKILSRMPVIAGIDVQAYPGPVDFERGPLGHPGSDQAAPRVTGLFGYSVTEADIQPVSLRAAMISEDAAANLRLYGTKVRDAEILSGVRNSLESAADVHEFLSALSGLRPAIPVSTNQLAPETTQHGEN
jgi:hypothetical protein